MTLSSNLNSQLNRISNKFLNFTKTQLGVTYRRPQHSHSHFQFQPGRYVSPSPAFTFSFPIPTWALRIAVPRGSSLSYPFTYLGPYPLGVTYRRPQGFLISIFTSFPLGRYVSPSPRGSALA